MKKTIKYLQNGEYHYATVKDVGDIDLLKTSNKDDLVSAINEIIVNGVAGSGGISQDQLDKINSDILGVSADIAAKYSELQGKISDGDAMQASLRAQAIKDINGAIAAANAAIEEYKKANEEAVKATQADIDAQNDRIDRINEQADALRTDLATAQTDLTQTKTDLSNATLDFGKVKKTVVDLQDEVSTKLSNTDLDPLNQKIQSVESNVKQTKDELSQYVRHDEYDLTTGEVNKIKSNVQQLADRIETKVSRDTLNDDINEFVVKKANLLVQTRDWSIIDDVGWTFSNDGLIAIQAELYDHAHVLELHQTGVYAEQTVKGLHGGQSYTVSISAKTKDAASGVNITLVGNDKTLGIMRRVKTHDTDISTEYERYEYTLVAPSDTLVLRFIATGMASSNVLYLYKAKLEEGTKSYEWEMNVNDIYAKVEKNSAKFTTYDDRITGVVTKQRDFGTWKEQAQSTLTQTAEGLELNNQKLKSVDGDVVDVIQSKIDASAEKLTSNYEKFTNQQVGMIVDEGTNQILNSAFTYYDLDSKDVKKRNYTFDNWQNISAKATIKSINKVNWVHMAQSGLSDDNPISITSNTFPVKQGKVIIGVDVLTPNVRAIDNQKVLVLQFYDDEGTRVDYREVSLHDLGLDTIQSNVSKRGTYRVGIDRKDVTKMTILARLPRNGEINFTNFFAKVSSLDNGDYQPNPADLQQQTIKQQTAIEQTADTIRQKADQTTVDTLNGTVQRQGTLIEQNAQHIQLKADGTTVTALSNKTDELSQLVSKHSASLEVTDKAITQQASAISSVTTIANGANSKIDNLSFGGRNLLNGSSTLKIVGQADSNVRDGTWRLSNYGNSTPLQNVTNELPPGVGVTNAIKISPLTGAAQDRASLSKGTYTFSVWLKGTKGAKYHIQPFWNNTATYASSGEMTLITSDWDRVSFTVDLKTDESVISTAYVYNHDKTNVLYMAAPQLEKGSHPSDYSLSQNDLQRLASEDTASQINQYNTGTVQPIKGIANDALGKANSANNKIDGLRIGGRNLLKGTSDQFKTITRSDWMNAHTYSNYPYVDLSNFHTGNYLTYSVWVTNTSDVPVRAEIYCFDKNKAHTHTGNDYNNVINPGNSNWLVVTMPIESNDWYARPSVITTSGQTGSHTIRMREEMLTLGNVRLPWQPSDLDLPDTIITTVTETSNAKQIIDSWGIHTEINSVKTETTGKINEVNNRVSDVSGRVDNVNSKIDNLKVGGTNLLDNSSFAAVFDDSTGFHTKWYLVNSGYATWNFDSDVPFSSGDDRSLMVQVKSPGSDTNRGIAYQSPVVKANTEYTISFWAKARANGMKIEVESNAKRTQFNLSTSWQRYEGVITFQSDNRALFIHNWQDGAVGQFLIFHPQLELGNKASDWSLSQNDVQKLASKDAASQINTFNTNNITPIKQTVTQYTNKTEELSSSVTHFMGAIGYDGTTFTDKFKTVVETAGGTKETYKALEGKIDGIVVGGKNLLDNSDSQLVMGYGIDNTTWTNGKATLVYNHDYSKTNKSSEILPQTGSRNQWYRVSKDEELTQSIIVETDATYDPNGVYQFTWVTAEFGHRLITANIDVLGTNKYRLWCSFKWDKVQSCNVRIMNIQNLTRVLRIDNSGTYINFYHPQIERGNKPSDWGMSDNDINAKVAEAKNDLTQYTSQQITNAKQKMTEYTNDKTKDISKIKQTADKVSISVGKMFGQADASNLNVDANGIKLRSDLIQLGTSDSYQNMVTVDPYDDKTTIPSSFYGGTAIDYRQYDGETRGIKKANINNDYIPLSTHQPLAGVHPQDKIYFKMKFGNYSNSNCGYSLELWVYDGTTYRGKHVLASASASSAGAIPARNWERIEGWWVAPSNLFYGAGNPRYVLAINGTKGFDVEVLRPRVSRSQMTDIRLDGDVTIAPGFKLNADYIQSGTLNTNNLIMKHPQGSTVTFTQDGFDVQKSDNREAFYTIGGDGIDFWRMTKSEAMNDYPAHTKPGYAHLGSLVALDNSYTKSARRVDRLQQGIQQNTVSNDNGIGFIIDVTGGSDTFSILQKGAEYRNGDRGGRINFNDTVNNSHFPIWEVNATGFRSLSWDQSEYTHGRGILHYTNTYFYTDPVVGNASEQNNAVNYHPSQRLGRIGNNGYRDFEIVADNNNTMAVGATAHNQNVWVNGFIFGSQNGADRIFGYDGSQWVDFVNGRTTRDNNAFTNHFGSIHLWELQYGVLTHTSQLSKKTDIEPLDTKDFASKILSIDLYKYRYKTQDKNEKDNYGAIIDDVNEVKQYNLPQEFITTRDKGINDSHLITGLIATVQEQAKQIEQLSFRLLELERGASINE
ncbi:hypothetical protein SY212_04510 [Ligilactobacillus agilis]|uniref:Peptidase S74 domain-containing protein n=1 Tax=Ligilactobacillus agilis TaxID=1601 RepID=A0A6F9XJH9_9LACO|nr:hypothetical protein [Ligilactobacillus agilis]GET05421.1 hypothetical protein SY212_04510 [Ligilactobacillus agilis]